MRSIFQKTKNAGKAATKKIFRKYFGEAKLEKLSRRRLLNPLMAATVLVGLGGAIGGGFYFKTVISEEKREEKEKEGEKVEAGSVREGLPFYTKEEVSKHKTKETRIWVFYKEGVYDITDFVESHPGGKNKISLAAGASIEPFWKMYPQHKIENVFEVLESLRIGNLRISLVIFSKILILEKLINLK